MAGRAASPPVDAPLQTDQLNFSAWVEVNLDNMQANLLELEKHSQVPILPVLKGDAYGHGAPAVAAFLQSQGYGRIAVSTVDEALPIVKSVRGVSVLLLTPPLANQIPLVVKHRLIPTVAAEEVVSQLAEKARLNRRAIAVELKIDTGFGRLGASPDEALHLARLIKNTPWLKLQGVFTHFSSAFHDLAFTESQLAKLLQVRGELTKEGCPDLRWHAASSAAFLTLSQSHLDLVRIGTLLYGQAPLPLDTSWRLAPTWACKARIIQIRDFPRGQTIGYGKTYRTRRPTRAGIIALGYGHGLHIEPETDPWRQIKEAVGKLLHTPHSAVSWGATPLPILGRIGMGLTCVDLTAAAHLQAGDALDISMRRVTASQSLPRIYLRRGEVKYIALNGRLAHLGSIQ